MGRHPFSHACTTFMSHVCNAFGSCGSRLGWIYLSSLIRSSRALVSVFSSPLFSSLLSLPRHGEAHRFSVARAHLLLYPPPRGHTFILPRPNLHRLHSQPRALPLLCPLPPLRGFRRRTRRRRRRHLRSPRRRRSPLPIPNPSSHHHPIRL